jgi:hypothetical protein
MTPSMASDTFCPPMIDTANRFPSNDMGSQVRDVPARTRGRPHPIGRADQGKALPELLGRRSFDLVEASRGDQAGPIGGVVIGG